MTKPIKKFKKLIDLYGAAQVSVWLGYRDTRAVLQWIQREQIPEARLDMVRALLVTKLRRGAG